MKTHRRKSDFAWPLALAFLAAVAIGALYHGGGALYFGATDSDLTNQFYPWRVFLSRWLSRGIFPLWDPHVFGGYPVAETQQMALFYPVSIFSALLCSPRISLITMAAIHVVMAVLLTYAALRRALRLRSEAAFIGTTIYVFGAVFSIRIAAGHFTVVAVMAWIPFAVCAAARGVADRARFSRWMLAACVANAMVLLAGSPQYVVYLFWMQAVAILSSTRRKSWIRALLTLSAAWLLAALIAAPQWLPTLFYIPFTGRSSGGNMSGPTSRDLIHLAVEFLLPFPMGDDMRAPHLHMKNVWETCGYPGAIAFVLASSVLFDCRRCRARLPARRIALSLVALGVYLAVGGWLPGFSSFREPLKARAILAVGVAFCAAVQAHRLSAAARLSNQKNFRHGAPGYRGWKRTLLLSVIGLVGYVCALAWVKAHPLNYGQWVLKHGPPIDLAALDFWNKVSANPALASPLFIASAMHAVVALILALGILVVARWHPRASLAALLLVAALDPFIAHIYCYYSRNPFDAVELPRSLTAQMSPKLAPMLAGKEIPWRVSLPPLIANRGHLLDGLNETAGYDPLMPRDANNRIALIGISGTEPSPERDAAVSGAIGRRFDLQHWEPQKRDLVSSDILIYPDASLVSIERKVRILEQAPEGFGPGLDGWNFVVSAKPGLSFMRHPTLDAESALLIDAMGKISDLPMATGNALGTDHITAEPPRNPNRYDFSTEFPRAGLFVFRMTWLPGWSVRVDDSPPRQPLCANGWMLAAFLPGGKHTITFHYRPLCLTASLWLSALGCATALLLFCVPGFQRPRRRNQ